MSGLVLAVVEQRDGQYRKSAFEIASAAKTLAEQLHTETAALVIGAEKPTDVGALGAYGIKQVWVAKNAQCKDYLPEAYTQAVLTAIAQLKPQVVLYSASATGKDLAPRVAAKLGVGLASDCTQLEIVDGKLVAKRPVYAGKAVVTVGYQTEPQMATLRPNVFTAKIVTAGATAEVEELTFSVGESKTTVKEFRATGKGKIELTEAEMIVSGGRGLKAPENFAILEELAAVLGAAVGASRAAVDAGWRPHADQVGQTGKTVSPNLYIAAGISGAIQHLAGMSSSKVIVAINKDAEAPIFTKADYGIVGDLFQVVPALTAEIKKLKA